MVLSDSQKAELTRKGNTLYNEGKYFEAGKIFALVGYKTGLIRLGDLFYFEKEMPLVAYGFYRNAQHQPMLDKIGQSFVFALKCLLTADGEPESSAPLAYSTRIEEYSIREANSPEAGGTPQKSPAATKEEKVARALGMLRKLAT